MTEREKEASVDVQRASRDTLTQSANVEEDGEDDGVNLELLERLGPWFERI